MSPDSHILFFDGYCNLCNGLVRFVIRKDRNKRILFSPLSSAKAESLLQKAHPTISGSDTVILFSEGKYYSKSTAILKLLKVMGGGLKLLYAFIIVPKILRDFIYDIVARNRHRFFGRTQTCIIPSPETEHRFLL